MKYLIYTGNFELLNNILKKNNTHNINFKEFNLINSLL